MSGTWPASDTALPNQWTDPELINDVKMNGRVDANLDLLRVFVQGGVFGRLYIGPGGNTDTTTGAAATWITVGNITVPPWAGGCYMVTVLQGIYDTGTTSNVTVTPKIGSASGQANRPAAPGIANQRFYHVALDQLSGLSTGSQSVTLLASFTAGSAIRADTTSRITALFLFTS